MNQKTYLLLKYSSFLCCLGGLLFLFSCQNHPQKKNHKKLAEANEAQLISTPKIAYGFNLGEYSFTHDTIQKGDTFGSILNAIGISKQKAYRTIHSIKDTFDPRKIILGKPYIVVKPKDKPNQVKALIYLKNSADYTVINMGDSIYAKNKEKPITTKRATISGVINSSLSSAMHKAGAGYALIQELENIYQWKIDLFHIKKGDKFKIIYNKNYIEDSIFAGIANVEAAEFIHYGDPYYAFRFGKDTTNGAPRFYDDSAKSLQNFFLKAPVKFTRISSHYTKRRYHPILHRYMAHLGTDYAAPTGTPIHVTASGVVIASRYTKYNGNYVKVRHNSKYTTQYLHMSKRLVHKGQHVKQGQVIGLVGQTGLATGPHVCYRFWVNGKQKDPYKQKMPSSEPLPDSVKTKYFKFIKPLKEELDNIDVEGEKKEENLASLNVP